MEIWEFNRADHSTVKMDPNQGDQFSNDDVGLAGLTRTDQAGLSIFIPFLSEGIDEQTILSGIVKNYYFPILSGRFEVEVGDIAVNSENFLSIAQALPEVGVPFSFIKEISERTKGEPDFFAEKYIGKRELDDGFFQEEVLVKMKATYSAGRMIKGDIVKSGSLSAACVKW